ncbi:hypothetical protein BSKO_00824 [Bryopsis sp. KO-2023]|nr:hypothetical protein BSKO_00824 [Bryopsis sp. KO-2023]
MHRASRIQGIHSHGLVTRRIRPPPLQRLKLSEGGNSRASRGRRGCLVCKAAKSLYDVLGVSKTASTKELKSAFKKKALKLHPDVNKEPGAQQKFMEAKNAYTTLSDAESRRKYDVQMRMGGFDSWSSSDTSSGFDWGQPAQGKSYKTKDAEFYGFDDFFNDLEKDFAEWEKQSKSGKPKSLWAELEDLGLEFVEFLEQGIGIEDDSGGGAKSRPSASGAKSGSSTSTNESRREQEAKYRRPEPETRKSPEDDIEDMLRKMKSDLGL